MRRALVTGASAGIGAAFAERLARDGYDVILVARGRERLEALARRLRDETGSAAQVLAADLTQPTQLLQVEQKLAADGDVEFLVNSAGFVTVGCFDALDPDREEAEIRLNVLALTRLTRTALPAMLSRLSWQIMFPTR